MQMTWFEKFIATVLFLVFVVLLMADPVSYDGLFL